MVEKDHLERPFYLEGMINIINTNFIQLIHLEIMLDGKLQP